MDIKKSLSTYLLKHTPTTPFCSPCGGLLISSNFSSHIVLLDLLQLI